MELSASEIWDRILRVARERIPEQTFTTWLQHAVPVEFTGDRLVVRVADQFAVDWNEKKHSQLLESIAPIAIGSPITIAFRADEERQKRVQMDLFVPGKSRPSPISLTARKPALSSRYTFEQFVIGKGNEVAAAAASAVAQAPGKRFNPLFIYGPSGVGKTHLMQAVAHDLMQTATDLRVTYMGAEQFTNEYISSIKANSTAEFRRRLRETDLLLIDDVHFLRGKEATQEEFFHTFNALYEAGRQIILTSDRPPSEIPGIESRLVTRFQWGMVCDIALPDLELRIAILRKKAEIERLEPSVSDEVIRFLAEHIRSSVRELEGALIRLIAYASIKKKNITVALAQEALRDKLRHSREGVITELTPITVERIQEIVASVWNVTSEQLRSKSRLKVLTVPRQAAMALTRELLHMQLVEIGNAFGGRDHSTVIHSLERATELLKTDPQFLTRFEDAKSKLLK